jgi:hypothetical protein
MTQREYYYTIVQLCGSYLLLELVQAVGVPLAPPLQVRQHGRQLAAHAAVGARELRHRRALVLQLPQLSFRRRGAAYGRADGAHTRRVRDEFVSGR